MNLKIRSRGGRQAVPTEGETRVHNSYRLARAGLGCQAKNDKLDGGGMRQPSPSGRGCPATALSSAVAGRVRGQLPLRRVRKERIQTANGKRQNSNGLQFADFSNPKPFAI